MSFDLNTVYYVVSEQCVMAMTDDAIRKCSMLCHVFAEPFMRAAPLRNKDVSWRLHVTDGGSPHVME